MKMNKSIGLAFVLIVCSLVALCEAVDDTQDGEMNRKKVVKEKTSCKILVTHPEVPKDALDIMDKCQLVICKSSPTDRSEILEKIKGVDGVFWGSHEALNAEVLDAAGPQLKAISTMSAGIDYVDVEEVKKRKIPLGHTPVVLNHAVADLSIGLMLAAARRFQEGREKILSSNWENHHLDWMLGQDIRNATVGIFGFGGIGQTIGKRLQGFDIDRILYTNRGRISPELEKKFKATKVPFHELLGKSDILFISVPLTPETQGTFNSTAFAKMKKTAVLINTARGPIVNQDDLYTALKSGQIFAAGIDVMTPEPLPADHKLLTLPNLIITPHLGSATRKTRMDMATIAAQNILKGLAGETMISPAY